MKEALFYEKLKNNTVKCVLCPRNCVIKDGNFGFCGVRKNEKGKLYSLVFGRPAAQNVDPIEKKPLYHFHPGSSVFSIGTVSCNFRCPFCCNWEMSREKPGSVLESDLMPEDVVKKALALNTQGIAYTYNEPTIFFEYAYETAKIAKKNNLFNVFVTNGFTETEPVKKIANYLDAVVVDLKGFNNKYYKKAIMGDLEKIKAAILEYKKNKVWLEISNLVIEKVNDKTSEMKSLCKWISDNLGNDVPLHIIGFYPAYLMRDHPATSEKRIKEFYEIARKQGLNYIYARFNDNFSTRCPKCKKVLIKRSLHDFSIYEYNLKKDECTFCGAKINIKVT